MGILSVAINAVVVAAAGIGLAWLVNGRFGDLSARIDRFEDRVDKRMDGFQASLDAMRSDLTAVALAVGVQPRTGEAGSNR